MKKLYIKITSNFTNYPNNIAFTIKTASEFFDLHQTLDYVFINKIYSYYKLFIKTVYDYALDYGLPVTQFLYNEKTAYCCFTFQTDSHYDNFISTTESVCGMTDKDKSAVKIEYIQQEIFNDLLSDADNIEEVNVHVPPDFMDDRTLKNAFYHEEDGESDEEYCLRNLNTRKYFDDELYPKLLSIQDVNKISDYV